MNEVIKALISIFMATICKIIPTEPEILGKEMKFLY